MADFAKNIDKYVKGVTMPGGYAHYLPETLRKIDRHWDGKFERGGRDSTGKRKFFMHTSRPLSEDASKNIDLDTSMIKLMPWGNGMEQEFALWVYNRELKQWLEEKNFDELMNDLGDSLPKYGHIVVKKHRDGIDEVDIRNLRMDPAAPWLVKSEFTYEMHRMFRYEIENQKGWNGDRIEELFGMTKSNDFDIFECYDLEGDHFVQTYRAWITKPKVTSGGSNYSTEASINYPQTGAMPPIELFRDEIEIEDFPYREHKYQKVRGRWLGLGVMEYLFDNQIHDNEVGNMRMRALYLKALRILMTSDQNLGGNALRDLINGQIIKSEGKTTWLQADESDLSGYAAEDARWDQNASKKTFVMDNMNIPGKINKNVLQRLLSQQQNYYAKKREAFGIFIKNLLMKDVLPDFERKTQAAHAFSFSGSMEDMDQYVKFITTAMITKARNAFIKKTGFAPSHDDEMKEQIRLERQIRGRSANGLKLPKGFFLGIEKKIMMVITGENKDLQGETQWMMQLLQLVAQNPAVLQNKLLRTIVFKVLEMAGINPGDLEMLAQAAQNAEHSTQPPAAPGGGAPTGPGGPQGGAPQGQIGPGAPMPKMVPAISAGGAPARQQV